MQSVADANRLVTRRYAAPTTPPSIGDILNAIVDGLESIGLEIELFDVDMFRVADHDGRIIGEFHTRPIIVPRAAEPDPADEDEASADDPRWDERWTTSEPDDEQARRRRQRDRDITLTPEEQEWNGSLRPFSRNRDPLSPELFQRTQRALESYESHLRGE